MTKKKEPPAGEAEGAEKERVTDNNNPAGGESQEKGGRFNPYLQFQGFMIPNALASSGLCRPTDLVVYGRLMQYAGKDGDCRPSLSTLSKELSVSVASVKNALNRLECEGLIERDRPSTAASFKRHDRTRYFFLWHQVFDKAPRLKNSQGGGQNLAETRLKNSQDPGQNLATEENQLRDSKKENHNNNTDRCSVRDDFSNSKPADHKGGWNDLTELQQEYIELEVDRASDEDEIVKSKGAYKHRLTQIALDGELDTENIGELRERWVTTYHERPPDWFMERLKTMDEDKAREQIEKHFKDPSDYTIHGIEDYGTRIPAKVYEAALAEVWPELTAKWKKKRGARV